MGDHVHLWVLLKVYRVTFYFSGENGNSRTVIVILCLAIFINISAYKFVKKRNGTPNSLLYFAVPRPCYILLYQGLISFISPIIWLITKTMKTLIWLAFSGWKEGSWWKEIRRINGNLNCRKILKIIRWGGRLFRCGSQGWESTKQLVALSLIVIIL